MKLITHSVIGALALAGALSATATAASAAVCLNTRDIVDTKSKDGRTIDFTMRDGKVYRNHLHGVCNDLRFEGFAWVIRGPEEVCENMQSLKVLNSAQVCELGKFDPPVSQIKAPHPG